MIITEFSSRFQGEGTRAGLPCIFVRLTGCNLRCTWCDTAYAFHGGKKMSVEEVLARVDELAGRGEGKSGAEAAVPLVELTGGEPLCRKRFIRFAKNYWDAGYTVMIETSGERLVERLPREVIKILDVKCQTPGTGDVRDAQSRGADGKRRGEIRALTRRDYELRQFTLQHGLARRAKQVLFSPVFEDRKGNGRALSRALCRMDLAMACRCGWDCSCQIHLGPRRRKAFEIAK